MVWELRGWEGMISISSNMDEGGQAATDMAVVQANGSKTRGAVGGWEWVIAGGLLLLASTLICLRLLAA
jgi:hypothetical protein